MKINLSEDQVKLLGVLCDIDLGLYVEMKLKHNVYPKRLLIRLAEESGIDIHTIDECMYDLLIQLNQH